MSDYMADAEALFRNFARRHSFAIIKVEEPGFDLLMRVPQQPGLSFELTLALQNDDEINIGLEEFWSYFFPFEEQRHAVSDALDALATGECRLAIHQQLGRVVKRVLERRFHGHWRPIYRDYPGIRIPFLRSKISYLYNQDARPR